MKTDESGRSMVEMIAVLAIIGVITVGAMTGFRSAMSKLQANEIAGFVADVSSYAQIHNRNITSDALGNFEEKIPECIDKFKAFSNSKVTIIFKDTDKCKTIHSLVKTAFQQCQWIEKDETTGCYVNGGRQGNTCDITICPNI